MRRILFAATQWDDIGHEQTIICRQLLSGHVVGSLPIKSKTNLHRMIMVYSRQPIMTRPTVMAANMAGIIHFVETLLQYRLKPDENLVFLARLIIGVSH